MLRRFGPHDCTNQADHHLGSAQLYLRVEDHVGRSDSSFLRNGRFLQCMTYPNTPDSVMLDLITDCIARVDHLNRQITDRLSDTPVQSDAFLLELHRVHGELAACITHLDRVRAKRL